MTGEVTVTLDISLNPDAANAFAGRGDGGLQDVKNFPGFLEVRIVRHNENPCRFLFIQRWDSEEAYLAYIAWRTERGELQSLQAMATHMETTVWPHLVAAA